MLRADKIVNGVMTFKVVPSEYKRKPPHFHIQPKSKPDFGFGHVRRKLSFF